MHDDTQRGDPSAGAETDPAARGVPTVAPGLADHDTLEAQLIAEGTRARLFGVAAPTRVGRYVLVDKLGSGGMGVVFSAYDATLDRKVAIKFIHAHLAQHPSTRERFLREARAMARLSHANVVQIHEASEAEGRLFLALEFVVGSTLRAHLAAKPRDGRDALTWREIVAMFRAAGEGLAAAHAAGIVHRDFKPDNVLRTDSGAIKVADFGLAGVANDAALDTIARPHGTDLDATGRSITNTGAVLGTLAYMAPEQHRGQPCDARADQFAFCVALFEALHGHPPFAGETLVERATSVIEGRRAPYDARAVPKRVQAVVERGLAIDPNARWPSMDTLLEQLARATAPRRSGAWVLGAGGLVAAAIVLTRGEPTEAIDPCASAGAEANELASGRAERLVHFASAWTIARKEGCIAHRDGSISADLYDRRQACLDGELAAVRTRVELEGEVDAAIAIDPTAPSRCTDAVRLTAGPIPGSEGRAAWIDLREQLARAEASLARGDLATVDAIVATLTVPTVDDGRLADDIVANAAWLSARSLRAKGELDAALAATTDAAARADAIPDDELRARALVEAVRLAGVDLYRADEAHRLAALAHGALARAGVETMLAPGLHEALGLTAMYEGRLDVAATELQAALDGTHAPKTRATVLANLASVRLRSGDATRAVADLEQAALQLEAHAPDDEVALSGVLNNLGFALLAAGQPARALSVHERSLVLRERLFGIVSLEVANAAGGIGLALLELGRAGDARGAFERALAIRTATEGRPEDLAEVQFGLARALGSADPRALELANAALDAYRSPQLLDAFAREAATVAAWLAPTHMLDREVPP